jgi:sporulation protein YlmC with PRC-barrel domain
MSISFADKISGRTVLDANGVIVGTVDDLLLGDGPWRVERFRMRLKRDIAKDIGAASPLLRSATLDVPASMVRGIADAVILTVSAAALHELISEPGVAAPASDLGDGH